MKISADKNFKVRVAAALSVVAVALIQAWIVSAGTMTFWPTYSTYYDMLADAFIHGQTHLLIQPAEELLALPDPYDPEQNGGLRLHDALLYEGKYYLYWGPVPGLLLAPVKLVTGAKAINDAYLVFAFTLALLIFSALLMLELWRRFFSNLPWWTIIPGILVAGLGTPIPYLFGRAAIYEAAIVAGQAFLVGGIYLAFTALERERPIAWRLALAGLFWACAVGSRVSLVFAVAALALLVCLKILEGKLRLAALGEKRQRLAAFITPLLIGAFALGLYNYVRFGSWTELGVRYQLSAIHVPAAVDTHLTSSSYVLPSLFSYLLRPVTLQPMFPYVYAKTGRAPDAFPGFISKPETYYDPEPVAGILLILPFVWLALVPVAGLIRRWRKNNTALAQADPDCSRSDSLARMIAYLLCASILGMAPVLMMIGSTMRYLADMTPSLIILAMIGAWQGYSRLSSRPLGRRLWISLAQGLAFFSVACGLLLAITGYYNHFQNYNPMLFYRFKYWSEGSAMAESANGGASITSIKSSAGVQQDYNGEFFWLGQGATVIEVQCERAGVLKMGGKFVLGPGLPDSQSRRVLVTANRNYWREVSLSAGQQAIEALVSAGANRIILTVLDSPTNLDQSTASAGAHLLGVEGLRVEIKD